jgi:hypothetical protein
MSVLPATQNKRRGLIRNLMIILGFVLIALALASRVLSWSVDTPMLVVVIAFSALAVLQFETLDEVAKQGQYVSWYRVSMAGDVAIYAIHFMFMFSGGPFASLQAALSGWLVSADPTASFLTGMMVTPVLMEIGLLVCWAGFWLRQR